MNSPPVATKAAELNGNQPHLPFRYPRHIIAHQSDVFVFRIGSAMHDVKRKVVHGVGVTEPTWSYEDPALFQSECALSSHSQQSVKQFNWYRFCSLLQALQIESGCTVMPWRLSWRACIAECPTLSLGSEAPTDQDQCVNSLFDKLVSQCAG